MSIHLTHPVDNNILLKPNLQTILDEYLDSIKERIPSPTRAENFKMVDMEINA